jgi:hypothetical protein
VGKNPYYVLNILGKKEGWDPNGSFDNPDRHTIFVPEYTAGSNVGVNYGNLSVEDSVLIWMTSGDEFAVLDGNACDDGNASLQIGSGKYYVFVTALGKPGGDADLKGWYYDDEGAYCYLLGSVNIKRERGKPVWEDATDLFYIEWRQIVALGLEEAATIYGFTPGEPVWIFDFLKFLEDVYSDTDYYFWQLINRGLKHIQVRFYEV